MKIKELKCYMGNYINTVEVIEYVDEITGHTETKIIIDFKNGSEKEFTVNEINEQK